MDMLVEVLRFFHIAAGFSSLLIFWVPVVTQKGGKTHRLSGKAYVWLMWIVVGTAALLSIKNAWIGKHSMAAFLGFISLITANALWYAVAILRNKRQQSLLYRAIRRTLSLVIVLAALALITYGFALQGRGSAVLMFIFGGLGLTEVPVLLRQWQSNPAPTNWLKEHVIGICSSGIAAYTAFFVFGGNQFFSSVLPGYWAVIPWVAPGLVGTFGIRHAVRRFAKGRTAASVPR